MQNNTLKKYTVIIISILKSGKSAAYYALLIKCLGLAMWPIDALLSILEKVFLPKERVASGPIVFVVGIHRTGSTYVSQVLSDVLDVTPIGNFFSVFPKSKYFIQFLGKAFFPFRKPQISKQNYYGISKGFYSIGDAYEIWDKWFGSDHYNTPKALTIKKKKEVLDYFYWVEKVWGKTLLCKNNRNSLAIKELSLIFPDAYFVVVDRNPSDVILSTIRASKDFFGSTEHMWGLLPNKEFQDAKFENTATAYCSQYLGLEEELNSQLSNLSQSSYSRIRYEEFCIKPEQYIEEIIQSIKITQGAEIGYNPAKLIVSNPGPSYQDVQLKKEIEQTLDILKNKQLIN